MEYTILEFKPTGFDTELKPQDVINMKQFKCKHCQTEVYMPAGQIPRGWQITLESEWVCRLCNTFR